MMRIAFASRLYSFGLYTIAMESRLETTESGHQALWKWKWDGGVAARWPGKSRSDNISASAVNIIIRVVMPSVVLHARTRAVVATNSSIVLCVYSTLHDVAVVPKVARWQNLNPHFPRIAPGWRAEPGAQSKERQGSNFAAQRSGAIFF